MTDVERRKTRDASDDGTKERSLRAAISARGFIYRDWRKTLRSLSRRKQRSISDCCASSRRRTLGACRRTFSIAFPLRKAPSRKVRSVNHAMKRQSRAEKLRVTWPCFLTPKWNEYRPELCREKRRRKAIIGDSFQNYILARALGLEIVERVDWPSNWEF
ncbi:PREDICTED: uncharacterized protein LOC105147736 isoform X1 [Acromyrmex echinatior]|uniref:uncharacterized protein LOC105147736 isoform X1 n=1 Tax=Acromyrmex echinatior TaxID=103372 RepID=UPI000580F705|nr:PREDICTED: uncharacterized protein LOC105147736 isoform X1 [Acromyrmex echinatior]